MSQDPLVYQYLRSPLGWVEVGADEQAVRCIYFVPDPRHEKHEATEACQSLLTETCAELEAYFAGKLSHFSVPVAGRGTAFQQAVWQQLLAIPYGETTSYGAIAKALDNPKAVRAVGAANGKNPISIIVPCHRVIGSSGRLTGYAGGLNRKAWLLDLEGPSQEPQGQLALS